MESLRFLVVNGVPQPSARTTATVPTISSLLQSIGTGAYTTTRTSDSATLLLLWRRHLSRLHHSLLLLGHRPGDLSPRINGSLRLALDLALAERERTRSDAELAVTVIVGGKGGNIDDDVWVHLGFYVPMGFGSGWARLAVAGKGRGEMAEAKYCNWARQRKGMEKMRPPMATELLLSDDGDHILEGSVTNFFVVCLKDGCSYEVQTAPVTDGVLPGVIRQVVIEACSSIGIPLREVAPSWTDRDLWQGAFVTNFHRGLDLECRSLEMSSGLCRFYQRNKGSLRLVQPVETIQVPSSCENLHLKTWMDVSWVVKQFEGAGVITAQIQREVISRAGAEGYPLSDII